MAADQRMPIALAALSVFERNSRSGISGCATLASITRYTANSSAAAASRPSVCGDVQPAPLAPTIA